MKRGQAGWGKPLQSAGLRWLLKAPPDEGALDSETLASERKRIHALFASSRPHYLIDTLADLPQVVADINQRLARGETPQGC